MKKQAPKKIIIIVAVALVAVSATYVLFFHNSELSKPEVYSLRPAKKITPEKKVAFEDFVGSEACKACHEEAYNLWKNSTHGKAGGEPGNVKVIAKFNGVPLKFKDATVIPKRTKQDEYRFEVFQNGKLLISIKVDAVVGGGHLYGGSGQSFFSKFPDGTLRFLPFDFNGKENTWFVQLRNAHWVPISEEIALGDLPNWLPNKVLGSRFRKSSCQDCHGSQILLEKHPRKTEFRTRYKTLRINCESCHGPGRKHIELVQSEGFDGENVGMQSLSTLSKDQSLDVCFQCHAVKDVLQEGYLPGDDFQSFYSTKLPILFEDINHADGRVKTFAYQQNHLFSDCYVNGSMTCVDCHSPHRNQEYRDIFGRKLVGKFDNGQCTGCHASKAKFPEQHSKHKQGSPGNLCTNCHMPFLQHKEIGDELTFKRSDHVIPIPRPEYDAGINIENACKQCHEDMSIPALQEQVNEWWGEIKPHNPTINNIIDAKDVNDINVAAELLLQPESKHAMAQFKGLATFVKRFFLKPNTPAISDEIFRKLTSLTKSDDIDVKSIALMCIHLTTENRPEANEFLYKQLEQAGSTQQKIRLRWAQALYFLGSSLQNQKYYQKAITFFRKAIEINPYDSIIWNDMGVAYAQSSDFNTALQVFESALQIEPYNVDLYFNMVNVYQLTGNNNKALEVIRKILEFDPNNERALQALKQARN